MREIVDGQQRIRTLVSYIDGSLLHDWDSSRDAFTVSRSHNRELAGKSFTKLDDRLKSLILSYEISTHILPPDTSDMQVLDIFRRMNATGTKLNDQELRNAQYHGEFITSVYNLSLDLLDKWRSWKIFSENDIARMQEAEFLSELYIVTLNGISERTQAKINSVYEDYDISFKERAAVERRVLVTLDVIDKLVDVWATPFQNRILFYPLFAAVYDYVYGIGSPLDGQGRPPPPQKAVAALIAAGEALADRESLPAEVTEALLSRSNRKSNRQALFAYIRHALG
jgi:hypothetical protein